MTARWRREHDGIVLRPAGDMIMVDMMIGIMTMVDMVMMGMLVMVVVLAALQRRRIKSLTPFCFLA